jgi:hypothetical protein
MSATYPTTAEAKVVSVLVPFMAWITQADPNFQSEKRREVEYETTRRIFFADPARRGAYE